MKPVQHTQNYKFWIDHVIPCYQVDSAFRLTPTAFMDMAQDLAYWAATELGFGYDDLHLHHVVWVLSRMHFHFDSTPKWRDEVRLYSWHKGGEGVQFLRDFQMQNPQGEILASATSSWLVMDESTHRLVRDLASMGVLMENPCHEDAIVERAPKLIFPKHLQKTVLGEHVSAYTDIDLVGHTNNVRYIGWALDCIDYETVSGRAVKDVYINFNREVHHGSKVILTGACETVGDDIIWYVEGEIDGLSSFITKIVF